MEKAFFSTKKKQKGKNKKENCKLYKNDISNYVDRI